MAGEGTTRAGCSHFLLGQASQPWSVALQHRQKCSYLQELALSLQLPLWNLRQVFSHLEPEEEEDEEDEEERGLLLLLCLSLLLPDLLLDLEGVRGAEVGAAV